MAITIKCPECGHSAQSDDGEPRTCPMCEGTMTAPPKKKYQAKSTSLEEESRAKKKSKTRDDDEERPRKKARPRDDEVDEDEKPAKKAKFTGSAKKALSLDDEDEDEKGGDSARDGKAAEALELYPGFKNRALMKQVAEELSRGEVLHFACRPCEKIARMQGYVGSAFGGLFAVIGVVVLLVMIFSAKPAVFVYLIPVAFILLGGFIAVIAPIAKIGQAKRGWYAITDRRAIVFTPALWGSSGLTESYEPSALRRMWIKKSMWVTGAGDLIFKSETRHETRTTHDARGRRRTETHTTTTHFGFLGVEDVKDVETLIHEVLLSGGRARDDDEDDED
jgi:hypothetical protein